MAYSRRQFAIIFALAMISLNSCGRSEPLLTQNEIPPDTIISLERTACFGACPIYTVTISADGTVTYIGKRYVRQSGKIQSSISNEELRGLIHEFEKTGFFEYENSYGYDNDKVCEELWTDNPSAITAITIQGKSKRVEHDYGCRGFRGEAELTNLEKTIDKVVNTAQWIDE